MGRPRGTRKQRELWKRLETGADKFIGYIWDAPITRRGAAGPVRRIRITARACDVRLVEIVRSADESTIDDVVARVMAGEAEGIIIPSLRHLGTDLRPCMFVEQAKDHSITVITADRGRLIDRGESRDEALPFSLAALMQADWEGKERIPSGSGP
jgi:hypothetical protein